MIDTLWVEISETVIYQVMGDETVLYKLDTQEYFALDDIGAAVWQLLMTCGDVGQVTERLATVYAIDGTTAREDVKALVSDLLAAKLLRLAGTGTSLQQHP